LELTYTSVESASTAVPAPVAFPTRGAASSGVTAAPPGVEYSSLTDGADVGYWGQLRVDVAGASVDGIVLPLRRPAIMSGRFVWAPGAKPSTNAPRPILEPADGRRSLGIPSIAGFRSDDPTTFTIDGLMAGEYLLRVRGGAKVESIAWNGQDYTDRAFDGAAGRDITGVVVTLTTASSSISGIVRDSNAPLTAGAAVIAFPVEREGWSNYGFTPPRLTSVFTTSDGNFRVDGLPPGEYHLLAVPAAQERAWLDPSFLAAQAVRAARVRVERNDSTIANLSLSLVK